MIWFWVGFVVFVLLMLAIDLGVFHRHAHTVSIKEALIWSAVWITMSLIFNVFIYYAYSNHWLGIGRGPDGMVRVDPVDGLQLNGKNAATKFFTGYVIEKSLSVDNIFVIALIFAYFRIPALYQHRVLFWGIIGALIMRGVFIGLGSALIKQFHWILYIFGLFLIWTAYKMITSKEDPNPKDNFLVRFVYKRFPITEELHGQHFIVHEYAAHKINEPSPDSEPDVKPIDQIVDVGPEEEAQQAVAAPPLNYETAQKKRWVLTPLALALIVVEGTDLIFAVDSIPAIFAITADPFLVFTSNIFAVLGLRALYFALAGILDKFHYLKISLAIVLGLVGVKMLVADFLKQYEWLKHNLSFLTLGMIALILGAGVVASLVRAKHHPPEPSEPPTP